ncbi:hypothetical protein Ccrd_007592, partial [Cynara cardunculus var. scolymus]
MDKWMSMSDTGLVITSFYRRPVVFISMVGSSTCFRLWSGPHESESIGPIVVAHVTQYRQLTHNGGGIGLIEHLYGKT